MRITKLIIFVAFLMLARAATAQTTFIGPATSATFDATDLDASGVKEVGPITWVIAVTPSTVIDAAQVGANTTKYITGTAINGANTASLATLTSTLAEGSYRIWLALRDSSGNTSAFVGGLLVTYDKTAPKLPANLKIVVTVTVGP